MLRKLIITLAAIATFNCSSSFAVAGKLDGRLDIYWIDVEGGAATLVVTPVGESLLIDTGNPAARKMAPPKLRACQPVDA